MENRRLSGPKSGKEIRHIVFDLGDSDIRYEAGDAIGVIPVNSAELVDLWLKRLGVAYDTILSDNNAPLGDRLLNWLFFGKQHREHDFIYEEDISEMSSSGLLTRLDLAFSRDQSE